jgi:AcrR family transcriptional regulator
MHTVTDIPLTADDADDALAARAKRDPAATRSNILDAAIVEFSQHGLAGARIDRIADRMRTSKRMIYYYFGSKDELYREALVASYRRIRSSEVDLHLERYEPVAGLQMLIRATLLHFEQNPGFIRIVLFENSLEEGAMHLMTDDVYEMNQSALGVIDDLLARGRAQGVFREGFGALDVHQVLTSLAFFRLSDQSSFNHLFHRDMLGEESSPHVRALIEETVLRLVLTDPDGTPRPMGEP